ncbi:hypothetical protein LCGC14_1452190 [marine sediment metagenome]|uniref:Uncharacterized protein n=1 Tax=marine sediment metagenome TaxID=412755 RepID=A0A0F9MJB0_9ZZZZ
MKVFLVTSDPTIVRGDKFFVDSAWDTQYRALQRASQLQGSIPMTVIEMAVRTELDTPQSSLAKELESHIILDSR